MTSHQPPLPMAELRRRANMATFTEAWAILGCGDGTLRALVQLGWVRVRHVPRQSVGMRQGAPLMFVDLAQAERALIRWRNRKPRKPKLASLPVGWRGREIQRRADMLGYSLEQIASDFGITVSSVRRSLYRSRAKARKAAK